jgi:hypothetical protein
MCSNWGHCCCMVREAQLQPCTAHCIGMELLEAQGTQGVVQSM